MEKNQLLRVFSFLVLQVTADAGMKKRLCGFRSNGPRSNSSSGAWVHAPSVAMARG
jgi:hypothetical protein